MRILDVELQSVLDGMSEEELDKLSEIIDDKKLDMGYKSGNWINPFFDGKFLAEQVKSVVGADRAAVIDDEKAYNDITDEEDKLAEEGRRILGNSSRQISSDAIKGLIDRAKIMNRGRNFAEDFSKKTPEERQKYYRKISEGDTHSIDKKYGISFYDKAKILHIIELKEQAKEIVASIPEDRFSKVKYYDFEQKRNHPEIAYSDRQRELEGIVSNFYVKKPNDCFSLSMTLVDFSEAFDERAKEIEEKKKPKENIFAKIKNWLMKGKKSKVKALPEANSDVTDTKVDYLNSLKVNPKDMSGKNVTEKTDRNNPSKDDGPSI